MKHYNKTYEDVFSQDQQKSKVKLNLDAITIDGMDVGEYIKLFHNFLGDFYTNLFNNYVKLSWLRRKFCYFGQKTLLPMEKNGILLSLSFVKLMRRFIGHDIQIITRGKAFSQIEGYFDDFFPGFLEGDPFSNPEYYKFPYKNITVEYLCSVCQIDERLDILAEAEKEKMPYADFLDFAINYALSKNDELGRVRYQVKKPNRIFAFYIIDLDKQKKIKKNVKTT